MSFLAASLSLTVPLILGMVLLAWTCPTAPFRHAVGNIALAHLVGSGAITILLVLTQLVSGRLSVLPVYLVLLALLVGWKRIRSRIRRLITSQPDTDPPANTTFNQVVFRLLLLFVALCIISTTLTGLKAGLAWDAWSFWQLKARAFYIDGNMSYLKDTVHCFHPEYPPMIPLLSYWVFAHSRSTADAWPQIIGLMLFCDLLAISYASFRLWIGATPSLASTALIASSRVVQKYALAGYADVAASAFMLATAVFLVRRFIDKDKSAGPPLMWMLALTCLVKNETIAWSLAAIAVVGLFGIVQRSKSALYCIAAFVIGYLPWLSVQTLWHLRDEVTTKSAGSISGSAAVASMLDILSHLAKYAVTVGPQYPAWGLVPLLFAAGLFLAARRRNAHVVPLLLLIVLQFIGYVVVLVWAIWVDPGWYPIYMNDTLHRCLLQVFPTVLLVAGLGCFAQHSLTGRTEGPDTQAEKDSAAAALN